MSIVYVVIYNVQLSLEWTRLRKGEISTLQNSWNLQKSIRQNPPLCRDRDRIPAAWSRQQCVVTWLCDCSTAASPDLAPLQAAVARRRHPPSSWSNALLLLDSSSRSVDKMGPSRNTGAHDLSYHLVAPNGPCRIGPICHCPPKIVPYLQLFLLNI